MGGISAAYKQAKLTENNVTERFWPKVNSRINYPINRAMNAFRNAIQDDDLFNLADPEFKYCVSWVMFHVTKDAADHFTPSWNHHRVPGLSGCIPIENMKATKTTTVIADFLIPSTPEALLMYEQNGGCLNRAVGFGRDLLVTRSDLYEPRTVLFSLIAPPLKITFSGIVHGINRLLLDSIQLFFNITMHFWEQLIEQK